MIDLGAIRARHRPDVTANSGMARAWCFSCADAVWPCDAIQLADALERLEEEYLQMRDGYAALEGIELTAAFEHKLAEDLKGLLDDAKRLAVELAVALEDARIGLLSAREQFKVQTGGDLGRLAWVAMGIDGATELLARLEVMEMLKEGETDGKYRTDA